MVANAYNSLERRIKAPLIIIRLHWIGFDLTQLMQE